MTNRHALIWFLAGFETLHAFAHAYFGLSNTPMTHPPELVGIRATPKFRAVSAIAAAIAAAWPHAPCAPRARQR